MRFFDRFKKEEGETKKIAWKPLNEMGQLDLIKEESNSRPVAIFKHSTRCGVSRGVLKSFEREYDLPEGSVDLYFLDLLANRDISNEVANTFGVHHESPQLIILKNGAVVYHNSHNGIKASTLTNYLV